MKLFLFFFVLFVCSFVVLCILYIACNYFARPSRVSMMMTMVYYLSTRLNLCSSLQLTAARSYDNTRVVIYHGLVSNLPQCKCVGTWHQPPPYMLSFVRLLLPAYAPTHSLTHSSIHPLADRSCVRANTRSHCLLAHSLTRSFFTNTAARTTIRSSACTEKVRLRATRTATTARSPTLSLVLCGVAKQQRLGQ